MKIGPAKLNVNALIEEEGCSDAALRSQADAQHLAMMLQSAREWMAGALGDDVNINLINDCISRLGPISCDPINAKGQKITSLSTLMCMLIYIHEEIMATIGDMASANILEELIRSLVKSSIGERQARTQAAGGWLN